MGIHIAYKDEISEHGTIHDDDVHVPSCRDSVFPGNLHILGTTVPFPAMLDTKTGTPLREGVTTSLSLSILEQDEHGSSSPRFLVSICNTDSIGMVL